ncbi:VWA domain-containing protein [Crocosphaera chwakensis]|uniref:VWA containing CoxE family protein n=1 Tax=Crocosphaera chwakensis CCY0110 TaxID=391612 RepID=A3ITZ2_9CHRO|nr:VWA domain-containing protein [Crocosphaera chwakensis]EAZ90087.1 hypothetical protein CY0110_15115 [Crocosphaera chwakensis CCY0110]
MNPHHLPLYYLFNALRRQGWSLGIDDYVTAVKLLETGIIVGNSRIGEETEKRDLEQLCSWLWAKSPQQEEIIYQLCQQIRVNYSVKLPFLDSVTKVPETTKNKDKPQVPQKKEPPLLPPRRLFQSEIEKDYSIPLNQPTGEVAQAVKLTELDDDSQKSHRSFVFLREYFPVTQRQMKQCWRSLRRLVREGKPEELDIEATIHKVSQIGIFTEPVLRPRRTNCSDLILLVDQMGSMVPFHYLSRQLIETAQRGGKLRKTDVYYFHNCPRDYLFQEPSLFEKMSLTDVFANLDNRAVALIISDAGAARHHYDRDRIEQTQTFLKQLRTAVRYCAWLNPMPRDTWEQTSASVIAQFIPMFSLSRNGLNAAISVLRGRSLSSLSLDKKQEALEEIFVSYSKGGDFNDKS